MWRSFASLGLVKHEAHTSQLLAYIRDWIGKSVIEGMGEKTMSKKLEGKVALITGGSRVSALQSLNVWPRTEHTWPSRTRRTQRGFRRGQSD